MSKWSICYKKAIQDDGTLLFPERLTKEFLEEQRRAVGSYIFANQYQNEVIPDEDRVFRKEWLHYYKFLPDIRHTFISVDPAIGQSENNDFTAVVCAHVDVEGTWFIEQAKRFKISATDTVELVFELIKQFKPNCIGIESVAYQKALIHMLDQESRRRQVVLPLAEIKPGTDKTKEMRISSLQPRFEWGRVLLNQGLDDLEDELLSFPRGKHDDLIDAMASLDAIIYYPQKARPSDERPNPQSPGYESWYIRQLEKRSKDTGENGDY
jgi:predicted phage terminase large subunit-like protein